MARSDDFWDKYVEALFRRGKAEELPSTYLRMEAGKVLKGEDLDELFVQLDKWVDQGRAERTDDGYKLKAGG